MAKQRKRERAKRGDDFDIRFLDGDREAYRYRVADGEEGLRLDQFLAKRFSWRSRTSIRRLIAEGLVELEGRSARNSRRLQVGEIVTVRLPRPKRDSVRLEAERAGQNLVRLFEDERLIAIDKPPNIPVHPAGRLLHFTVITELHRQYRNFDDPLRDLVPKLCHRLDVETSGVLLVAKDRRALTFVQEQFAERTVKKEYLVLVHGEVAEDEGLVDLPIGPTATGIVKNMRAIRWDIGQPSRTKWRVVERFAGKTKLHIHLLTGRHHQIRVHMAAIGHPVVGDKLYAHDPEIFLRYTNEECTDDDWRVLGLRRQALHSHALEFEHPTRGPMRIASPWPPDLREHCADLVPFHDRA